MTPETSSGHTLQICNSCGGAAPVDVHFCPQCTKVLLLGRQGDYFTFLGVPRKLNLDPEDLEQRFRMLSRQFHPDYFYNATPAERRASLERSSYLNDAYRTLKNPSTRIAYLLELEGMGQARADRARAANPGQAQVPAALLEEVFALNEELDAVRALKASGAPKPEWQRRLIEARQPIEAKQAEHEADLKELASRWDAMIASGAEAGQRAELVEALSERMLERNYIRNLLDGIERELTT
jgi:molecular chaperone HscB